jgi:MEMO1 family protein
METRRPPAVAGTFYPADPEELRSVVQALLKPALVSASGPAPKAIIAPHAGYVYSGPIAATAYARLWQMRDTIRRVVLVGPSHRVPFGGLAASSADLFSTPLGDIPVDREALTGILDLRQVQVVDAAHAWEHSLEVQLPFLQEILPRFSLVPLVAGDASPNEVAEVMERLWDGPETVIVVSSDLSHYHDYETARRMDRHTSGAIELLQPEAIDYEQACGRIPITGLLVAARVHGLSAATLDMRNSGDTAGPRDQVVGYGAYAFA